MVALPPLRPSSVGTVLGSDFVAGLETGLPDAEARVANILSVGRVKHIKGRCGAEPSMYPGPCNTDQQRKFLVQPELYEQARQKVLNALAMNPAPADRERWYSASARWVNVMAAADNLAWTSLSGDVRGPGLFSSPDADTLAEDTRKRVFDAAQAVKPWAHRGDRKVHIDLVQGLPVTGSGVARSVGGSAAGVAAGAAAASMWVAADDYFTWSPWTDYDTVGVYRDCGGVFGGACPGYPDGKRYHRTIYTNGATRVAWWKKKLEVYSKHSLVDLLAYAWGGYSEYLDLNASKLNMTPAQMRAFAEAKTRADFKASQRAAAGVVLTVTQFVPALNIAGAAIAAILIAIGEYLPLASGCQFSFYEFQERVIDDPECGAWGEGRTATSTIPKMYGTLIAQGFDPQARLDELNAPPVVEPTTPPWLVPAAAAVGGVVVGGIIGKLVS